MDNSIWENEVLKPFELLIYQKNNISTLGYLQDQYKREIQQLCQYSDIHKYMPVMINDDIIFCGCGNIMHSKQERCPSCNVEIKRLLNLNNLDQLQKHLDQYNQEQQFLKEQKEHQEEKNRINNIKIAKKLCIVLSCIIVLSIIGYVSYLFIPSDKRFLWTLEDCVNNRRNTDKTGLSSSEILNIESDLLKFENAWFLDDNLEKQCDLYLEGLNEQKLSIKDDENNLVDTTLWESGYLKRCQVIKDLQEQGEIDLPDDTYAAYCIGILKQNIIDQIDGDHTLNFENQQLQVSVQNTTYLDFYNLSFSVEFNNSGVPIKNFANKWESGDEWSFSINITDYIFEDSIDITDTKLNYDLK